MEHSASSSAPLILPVIFPPVTLFWPAVDRTFLGIVMFVAGAISEDVAYLAVVGPFTGIFSFIGILVALANPRYKRGVGVYYLVTGILFNLLLIVPAIMAFRWKPAIAKTTAIGSGTISQ